METEIIALYVICDEFLQAINHQKDDQVEMSNAEVMTSVLMVMLIASKRRYFYGLISFLPYQSDWILE
jgi:hypothetical protein